MTVENLEKMGVVILAAGEGKRMQSELPKVMQILNGKPLIEYVVRAVKETGLVERPVVVVGASHTIVQEYLQDRARYAIQREQLGTGHAVSATEHLLKDQAEQIVVLYGDMPFITSRSIEKLAAEHAKNNNTITFMTVTVPDFIGWRRYFYDLSRVVRDKNGAVIKDIQMKDATRDELQVRELNTAYFCFRASWLWKHLKEVRNNNVQREYYLTDLINMAIQHGERVSTLAVEEKEAVGINTAEQLELARQLGTAVF